ncbi:ABC transporter substrate-binding protein [Acidipropionibacterium timonense]|uniref:ABC transporter substrate-binding protein n=1 Tax=Acidipropionibacterium timonense TaxID=2161818 RepID=UPI001031F754|nr:extracellular solute-binding protein [Acidipropionibacterium timonense]
MMNPTIGRRQLLGGTGALATLLTLGACGVSGSGTGSSSTQASVDTSGKLEGSIQFQTWSLKNEKFTPYFEKLIKDFQTKHPGTSIKWLDQPGDGYEEKVQQQAAAGQLPDVVNLPQTFAYQLAGASQLMDLKKADAKAIDLYTTGGIESYTFDGIEGTYGYPWYLGTDLNWWNTKAFTDYGLDPNKLPTTLDELFDQALTMAKNSKGKMPLISSMPDFPQMGVTMFQDGKFVFNSEDGVELLQRYVDLYKAKAMPPEILQNTYLGNSQLFIQGKVAWTTGSASFPVDLKKGNPTLFKQVTMTKRIGNPPLFVQGLSVSAKTKNPALALAFAQFATNNENQVAFVKLAQGFLPGTKEGNENPSSFTSTIEDPDMKKAAELLADEMKTAKAGPVQLTDAMTKYLGQQMASAMRGDVTAKQALDKAADYCNKNLKK